MDILLVDDHLEVATSLAALLAEFGHRTRCAGDARQALALVEQEVPELVLSDVRMPDMDGPALMTALHERHPALAVAFMTAYGERHDALHLMRQGAHDYFHKPIDLKEVLALIERLAGSTGRSQGQALGAELSDGLVIHSPALALVIERSDRLHQMPEVPVLIEGETGTGKELIARRVHHGGEPEGENGPFVALNCSAIPSELFEAELFGYEAGTFTGGLQAGRAGKLSLACGGTLFLDEVAELPLDQQAKLLRVLETRRFFRLGGDHDEALHARVVCACNTDLLERVGAGRFREDLYYRLKVARLELPSLRADPAAIRLLVRRFVGRLRARRPTSFSEVSDEALDLLCAFEWPGNVRQLWHLLESASIDADGRALDARMALQVLQSTRTYRRTQSEHHLLMDAQARLAASSHHEPSGAGSESSGLLIALEPQDSPAHHQQGSVWRLPVATDLPECGFNLDHWQQAIIEAALQKHGGSPVRTARYLGLTRKVLYTLRKRYGLIGGEDS